MTEPGGDFPKPSEPQLGPRDEGWNPRSPQEAQQPVPQPKVPQAAPTPNITPESQARSGIINRLTGVGRRIADTLSATPEPKLPPDQVSAREVARRMMLSRDDRTHLGFSERAEMQWMGYITEPKPNTPEYQEWLAVSQGIRKANLDLLSSGILEQGELTNPSSGEKTIGYRVKDPTKLAQLAESKPVMQAHPQDPTK